MPEDEFRTDLEWPTDPFGRPEARIAPESVVEDPPPTAADGAEVIERLLSVLHHHQERLHAEVDGLRAEIASLRNSVDSALARPNPRAEGAAPAGASLTPVLEEIDRVRQEVALLKRRVGLRAQWQSDAAVLTDEQVDRIARAVAGLLRPSTERAR